MCRPSPVAVAFQSTPPARGATGRPVMTSSRVIFQSTPPARGATSDGGRRSRPPIFQSTPPARGATGRDALVALHFEISIHAPREGGDIVFPPLSQTGGISIHAPREGGDRSKRRTKSAKRDFNPRPPRGGRLPVAASTAGTIGISIHAPREGGDSKDAQFYLRIFDK